MNDIPLILIGAGLSCVETIDLINEINKKNQRKIKIIGILDDDLKISKKKILNVEIIGTLNDIKFFKKEKLFLNILSYKNRFKRQSVIKKILPKLKRFINLIHPNSLIGSQSKIGNGNCIYGNTSLYSYSKIGNFCSIMENVSVAPRSNIGDNCFISKDVMILSRTIIKKNCYISNGSFTAENSFINEGVTLLPNTSVNSKIKNKYITVGGSPAKIIF